MEAVYSSDTFYATLLKHCYSAINQRYSQGFIASGTKWPIHILRVKGDMSAVLCNLLHVCFHIFSHSFDFGLPWEHT